MIYRTLHTPPITFEKSELLEVEPVDLMFLLFYYYNFKNIFSETTITVDLVIWMKLKQGNGRGTCCWIIYNYKIYKITYTEIKSNLMICY